MLQRLFPNPAVTLDSQKIPLAGGAFCACRSFLALKIPHLAVKLHLTKRLYALTMRKILSSIVSIPQMRANASVFRGGSH